MDNNRLDENINGNISTNESGSIIENNSINENRNITGNEDMQKADSMQMNNGSFINNGMPLNNGMYMNNSIPVNNSMPMNNNMSMNSNMPVYMSAPIPNNSYRPTVEHQWRPNSGMYDVQPVHKKEKKKKEKRPLTFGKLFTTCVVFMIITMVANATLTYFMYNKMSDKFMTKSQYAKDGIEDTKDTINTIVNQTGGELSVAQIAEAVMPSVVAITSTSIIEQSGNPFWGYGGSYQVQGAGSGIIVGSNDTELLVVTNNHVVEDTTALTVQFTNDISIDRAYVKGTSADNDIAVVAIPLEAIDEDTLQYIKFATLGDSDSMKVGDGVIAIGNALGYGQSLTVGYVSAKDREITTDNTTLNVIQTDAAINGGNSGGALLNMKGEVIGINVAKSSSSGSTGASVEGMGYAIPISEAKDVIEELSNRETRLPVAEEDRGYIGIKCITSDESSYEYYNIPEGAYVREIVDGSPADKAGIVEGDVIVGIEGSKVSTAEELVDILSTYKAGEKVKLSVMVRGAKGYEKKEMTVILASKGDVS